MKGTILVVDDDKLITITLSAFLETYMDYTVICYNDPTAALKCEALCHREVDLVISDFLMPQMNGVDFLKAAREKCPDAVMILLTGYADKQNTIRCINELGIYYYLEKPWDNNTLLKIVSNGLEKKYLQTELKRKLQELRMSNRELNQWNRRLEQSVAQRTFALRNLLDNAGQGFLYFREDFLVQKEFSGQCTVIFGGDIEGKSFPALIFPEDEEQRSFVSTLLSKLFQEEDSAKLEVYLSLLPAEALINGRYIKVEYKLLKNPDDRMGRAFMAVLTDITEKKQLEAKMEEEKNTLRMIVRAVSGHSDLVTCLRDYYRFCEDSAYKLLRSSSSAEEALGEIFRHIHTFKGSFSMLSMTSTAEKLHRLEDRLDEMRNGGTSPSASALRELLFGLRMSEWPSEDLEILKNYLGEDFLEEGDLLRVSRESLDSLERKLAAILSPGEFAKLLPELRRLRCRPFGELLKAYPEYLLRLSEKLGKPINPLVIEGEELPVDIDRYAHFAKSLMHVFRNIMDHGLENADERYECGKDFCGNISCSIKPLNDHILLSISDDGRGMDPEKIMARAVARGLIGKKEAQRLNAREAVELIFKEGFSTKESADELSGRGIGLSAVKKELEAIGGTVEIITAPGRGTEFRFLLPYEDPSESKPPSPSVILTPLSKVAAKLMSDFSSIRLSGSRIREAYDKIPLKTYSSFIDVRGSIGGKFVITVDAMLMQKVSRGFLLKAAEGMGSEDCSEEVLSELANSILGGSMELFPDSMGAYSFGVPVSLSSEKAVVSYPEARIFCTSLYSEAGTANLYFITSGEPEIA